jgi:hypothetical protein
LIVTSEGRTLGECDQLSRGERAGEKDWQDEVQAIDDAIRSKAEIGLAASVKRRSGNKPFDQEKKQKQTRTIRNDWNDK